MSLHFTCNHITCFLKKGWFVVMGESISGHTSPPPPSGLPEVRPGCLLEGLGDGKTAFSCRALCLVGAMPEWERPLVLYVKWHLAFVVGHPLIIHSLCNNTTCCSENGLRVACMGDCG